MTQITAIGLADIDLYLEHLGRHRAAYGNPDEIIHDPHPRDYKWDPVEKRRAHIERWSKSLNDVAWGRAWAARDGDKIVGHLSLQHRGIPTNLHRAWLGMSVETQYRRQGIGRALVEAAIRWATSETTLAWIDLGVLAHNQPARRLYGAIGFQETGKTLDAFRVDGQSIDDIQMSLCVSPQPD